MGPAATSDTLVLGGGVIGLTVAWRVAQQGASVTLVDPQPGSGASFVAAGMLAPVTETEPGDADLLAWNLDAAIAYPAFVAALEEASGRAAGYRPCGTLFVAPDTAAKAVVDHVYRLHAGLGLDSAIVSASECRRLEPGLSPRIRGGLFAPGDHAVDTRALLDALIESCRRAGVRVVADSAARVTMNGQRVVGAETAGGDELTAGTVVVALGSRSGSIAGLPADATLPVRPVKGQLVHLGATGQPDLFEHNVRTPDVYLVSRGDGRAVVGATVEDKGFDTDVTAGAVRMLLDAAYEVLPGVTEAAFTRALAGSRPALPDNLPAIGPGAADGLVWATGHYRNGILLAPVTGDAVAELIATGRVPERCHAFSPQRFAAERVPT